MMVFLYDPVWSMRRSSARARIFPSPLKVLSRSLTTRFQRNGDNTPPCGHPFG